MSKNHTAAEEQSPVAPPSRLAPRTPTPSSEASSRFLYQISLLPVQENQAPASEPQTLIFTERRLLPKIVDCLLTTVAWLGFIWLIYQGLQAVWHAQLQISVSLLGLTFNTLAVYVLIALVNSALLIGWAKYNQRRFRRERRRRPQALPDAQLICHFGLSPKILAELNESQIAEVHHDQDGTLLAVKVLR